MLRMLYNRGKMWMCINLGAWHCSLAVDLLSSGFKWWSLSLLLWRNGKMNSVFSMWWWPQLHVMTALHPPNLQSHCLSADTCHAEFIDASLIFMVHRTVKLFVFSTSLSQCDHTIDALDCAPNRWPVVQIIKTKKVSQLTNPNFLLPVTRKQELI